MNLLTINLSMQLLIQIFGNKQYKHLGRTECSSLPKLVSTLDRSPLTFLSAQVTLSPFSEIMGSSGKDQDIALSVSCSFLLTLHKGLQSLWEYLLYWSAEYLSFILLWTWCSCCFSSLNSSSSLFFLSVFFTLRHFVTLLKYIFPHLMVADVLICVLW